jgi:putative addiction module CopG family antidote
MRALFPVVKAGKTVRLALMNVSLPTPLEDFVRRKVAAGDFLTVDEVVCEGLRLLQQQEILERDAQHKIDIGWDQAKTGQLRTSEEARANLAARKEAWKNSQGQ